MKIFLTFLLVLLIIASGCVGSTNKVSNNQSTNITNKSQENNNITQSNNTQTVSTTNNSTPTLQLKTFTITAYHTSYTPNTFTVNKGDQVVFNVKTSLGTENHNHGITIDEYSINVANTDPSNPTIVNFTADQAGSFQIYCKTCWDGPYGHSHPDIRATLIVK